MMEKKICYHADIKLEQMWSVCFSSTHLLVFLMKNQMMMKYVRLVHNGSKIAVIWSILKSFVIQMKTAIYGRLYRYIKQW